MAAPIETPDEWDRWELDPVPIRGRRTADERMLLAGKLVQAVAARKILERPAGSRLRRRMISTAIRGGFGLLNREEAIEPMLRAGYAEDCEMTYGEMFPEMGSGVQRGIEEIHRYIASVSDVYSEVTYQPVEIFDPGGSTFAGSIKMDLVGRASGIEMSITNYMVWTFREGRVWRQWAFREWPDAREHLERILAAQPAQPA